MTQKLFIVKDKAGKQRLIEGKNRSKVEWHVLKDYEFIAVKSTNIGQALELQAGGVKVEKSED